MTIFIMKYFYKLLAKFTKSDEENKKSKKEKKMGLGGWLKMQDLDEYDKALRGMGIDSVDALRKAVAAGTMAIVNKLEPDAKRHGRLYRPLRELAAKQ